MCYTRELLCVECNIPSKKYTTNFCSTGKCKENEKRIYLKYGICRECVELPEMRGAENASSDDLQLYVKFNRRARTAKGQADSPTRLRRGKRREGLTDEQVTMLVSRLTARQFTKKSSQNRVTNVAFSLQFDQESNLLTSSKPHLWADWADKLQDLLIKRDRERRQAVTNEVTKIVLQQAADQLSKSPRKRCGWGWPKLVVAPPSTPINPLGR